MKTFEDWLEDKMNDELPEWFKPDGNSKHAVMLRMRESKWKALKWEFVQVCNDVKYEIKSFDGFNTPIGWFVQMLLLPVIFPLVPFVRTYTRYKEALDEYKENYAKYVTKEMRKNNEDY